MLLFPAILLSTGALHAQVKKVKHVVLLGLDGLGSYAIPKAERRRFHQRKLVIMGFTLPYLA